MTWVAVAAAGGAVVSGYLASNASKKVAGAAGAASDAAIAENRRQFDQVRSDTAGQRFIGRGAEGLLARLYGYGPLPGGTSSAGALTGPDGYVAPATAPPSGFFNTGAGRGLNPATVSSRIPGGKIFDPAYGLFGNVFGGGGGSHKRNWQAFNSTFPGTTVNSDGNYVLPAQFGNAVVNQQQLDQLAGTWYGATYAPDGNQQGWQQQFQQVLGQINPKGATPGANGVDPSSGYAATPGGGVQQLIPGGSNSGVTIDNATGQVVPGSNAGPDMSAFFTSPDYQFRLSEGQKAIDRSAAARGGLLSGATVKAGEKYASNLASGEFGAFVDRLMQQAGLGSTGIGASAAAGANATGNITSALTNAGNARASSYLAGAEGVNNSIQGGIGNILLSRYLQPQGTSNPYIDPVIPTQHRVGG